MIAVYHVYTEESPNIGLYRQHVVGNSHHLSCVNRIDRGASRDALNRKIWDSFGNSCIEIYK